MKITHIVIKKDDVEKYLSLESENKLNNILKEIECARWLMGKKSDNKYLVINVDEPYAPEIIQILKKNGHWDLEESESVTCKFMLEIEKDLKDLDKEQEEKVKRIFCSNLCYGKCKKEYLVTYKGV